MEQSLEERIIQNGRNVLVSRRESLDAINRKHAEGPASGKVYDELKAISDNLDELKTAISLLIDETVKFLDCYSEQRMVSGKSSAEMNRKGMGGI